MIHQLEQANLFVVSLDSKRKWYRYHTLFAEALRYRLEQRHADLISVLHYRASLWYAEHGQTTQAISYAFSAKEWHWAADLIERLPDSPVETREARQFTFHKSLAWGADPHKQVRLQNWLKQLPADILHTRPRLCLACSHVLWPVVPSLLLQTWLDVAEAALTASLTTQIQQSSQTQHELENLLGEVITFRVYLLGFVGDGQAALPLCQRALTLLSADNDTARAVIYWALLRLYYASSANDAAVAIQSGLQGGLLAQKTGQTALAIAILGSTACLMVGAGKLHEIQQVVMQVMQIGTLPQGLIRPDVGFPQAFQAEVLREWNKLDAALSVVQEAISLCKETKSIASFTFTLCGYAMLLRILLSRRELDAARSALEQIEHISRGMNQSWASYLYSLFLRVDQVKLWLACGELDRTTRWAEELDMEERQGPPFVREWEEVACAYIFLAKKQPDLALQRLEPVLKRAAAGQRWGHVIEIQLLQALAYQMHQEEIQALDALSEAVRLAEPQGYIRSFVDKGAPMEALLYRLRKRSGKQGPTPYLDTLLTAFQQESKAHERGKESTKAYHLPGFLSERELEVLQLLALGASNLEIAQDLVIVVDTVKRHVSSIFSKLGVNNRVQAIRQAQELSLLDEER